MKCLWFILFLFVLPFIPLQAQDFYFSHIDGKRGLSHNNVKSILQDSYGFIWLGTRNRLNRYDGVTMKQFDCYDPQAGKGDNNISALYEDSDRMLWVGTDKGVFLYDPVMETFTFFDCETEGGITIVDWIAEVNCDADGNIWIVVPNQGVFKFIKSQNKLICYTVVEELRPSISSPQCITIEKNGKIWIGTNGAGVYLYNKGKDTFEQFLGDSLGDTWLRGKSIYTITHDNDYLYIGIHESKLMKLDKRRNILIDMGTDELNYKIIRHIDLLNDHELWVGTEDGLFIVDEKNGKTNRIKEDPLNPYSISDNMIEKIYRDREGGIWLGTAFGGVNYLANRHAKFDVYIPNSSNNFSSKRIREIVEDKQGTIWIGSEDGGLVRFDPDKKQFTPVKNLFYDKTLALYPDGDEFWVGYFKKGLDIIKYPQMTVTHYSGDELGLNEESICALFEDRYGRMWLGNGWGVFRAEKGEKKFQRLEAFGLSYTYDILEDADGYIWLATMGNGIFQYDPVTGQVVHFTKESENGLRSNTISSITEDHTGQLWFSTDRGGIAVYNKTAGAFKSYGIEEGLPDDITYKILEDKNSNLWFGTNQGLVRFNPNTKDIRVFTESDGLPSNQYNYKSGLVSSSHTFYMGSIEGLIVFNPDHFGGYYAVPPVYITRLLISNEEIFPESENSPLEKSIIHTEKIRLTYDQSNIGLSFVALNYAAPQSIRYAYKMENVDNDWVYTKDNHTASYAKLPPGRYLFRVKAAYDDGDIAHSEETLLHIDIVPAWWASSLAIAVYVMLGLTVLCVLVWYWVDKYRKRTREKQRIYEIEKEKELYEMKVNFFTDIAHEIRTPVTLINGPLEVIMGMELPDRDVRYNLEIIESNTKHLLNLINQLLDFRKIDNEKFFLNQKRVNVLDLIKSTVKRFEGQFTASGKEFGIEYNLENPFLTIDKEAFKKIMDNLFSNAVKYSDCRVYAVVQEKDNYFVFSITNDGKTVPDEFSNKIFEPFFQVPTSGRESTGSGIGLPLARSLAELHNGFLYYENEDGMNHFVLTVPIAAEGVLENEEQIMEEELLQPAPRGVVKSAQTILVVEDNKEMLEFISEFVRDDFKILKAVNGKEAQEILRKSPVDIIISDIMMPEMDGLEFCRYVKSTPEYKHIILILLTAKSDLDSKIEGLKAGADAYVEKPFSPKYVRTLISSLLDNRQRELELFLKKPFLPLLKTKGDKGDEEFLNRAIEVINEHIADPSFNVERLAEALMLSRSSLHRRVKASTDTSAIDFIRLVRLQRASQLILEGKYRINEICYQVGMSTPSYFIKLFQNHFGMTPKEFQQQNKKES